MTAITEVASVTDMHRLLGLRPPRHPLISVVRSADIPADVTLAPVTYRVDLYTVALKSAAAGRLRYGRAAYDFQEGTLVCTGPGQVIAVEEGHLEADRGTDGWTLFFHPDLLRRSRMAAGVSAYTFFGYAVNEALHLSAEERATLAELVANIEREVGQNLDRHSRDILLVNLESVLTYASRYYDRQFYTRAAASGGHVERFEHYLREYFDSDALRERGLPSVEDCGRALHMSGHYLSDLLRIETGKSAREHIHLQLVERAKDRLLGSEATVSEIAYGLGFAYPQHFSKLFKARVGVSPRAYRRGK